MNEELLNQIARFDEGYTPDPGRYPGIETLPDRDYVFEVAHATLGKTQNTGEAILHVILRSDEGVMVERPYFFQKQTQVNKLGADLCALGFDADKWRGNRPFSRELVAALPKLVGVKFRARKITEPGTDKPFHNLYINGRVGANTQTSRVPMPASRPAPQPAPPPQPAVTSMNSDSGDVPF